MFLRTRAVAITCKLKKPNAFAIVVNFTHISFCSFVTKIIRPKKFFAAENFALSPKVSYYVKIEKVVLRKDLD